MFTVKVAVAIAILKRKSDNMTGQQFAESLQRKFSLKHLQLEKDYAEAKMRISKLEKQIEHVDIDTKRKETGDHISHILTPPPSDNSIHKTQPSAGEPECRHDVDMVTSEIENAKFIQSVVNLENLNSSAQDYEGNDIVKTTTENISTLSEVLSRNMIALPESCLCKAAESIVTLLHRHAWLENIDHTMEAVCRLVEIVLTKIKTPSNPHQFPPHRQKNSLMRMLVVCMKTHSHYLSVIIMDSLTDAWEEFCQGLHSSRLRKTPVDPHAMESSFFIIRAIELTVKSWSNQCDVDVDALHSLQERLEKSLLSLSKVFPLVARAVWKVTAIIETILQSHDRRRV